MEEFKEGDQVICVNSTGSHYLKRGETYTVGREVRIFGKLYIKELRYSYHESQFELVNNYPTLRIGYLEC